MMKKLTPEEIKRLSERPNVKKVAVENFLMNMSIGDGISVTIEHLVNDSKLNKWNNETIETILDGILTSGGLEIENLIGNILPGDIG